MGKCLKKSTIAVDSTFCNDKKNRSKIQIMPTYKSTNNRHEGTHKYPYTLFVFPISKAEIGREHEIFLRAKFE